MERHAFPRLAEVAVLRRDLAECIAALRRAFRTEWLQASNADRVGERTATRRLRRAAVGALGPWALCFAGCGQNSHSPEADLRPLRIQSEPALLALSGPASGRVPTGASGIQRTALEDSLPSLAPPTVESSAAEPRRAYRSEWAAEGDASEPTMAERLPSESPLLSVVAAGDSLEPIAERFDDDASQAEAPSAVDLPGSARATHEMQAVEQLADQSVRRGYQLAEKGATYSARRELTAALRLLADSHDRLNDTTQHSAALEAGFAALREADDFLPRGAGSISADRVLEAASGHVTPILKGDRSPRLAPTQAAARYYTYAQEQFAYATGQSRVGAKALFGLGRITAPGGAEKGSDWTAAGHALVYYQACLMVDPRHFRAAHESGVVLAQSGRLAQARQMFQRAIATSPQAASWSNLAVVHERLGERPLADAARREAAKLGGESARADRPQVQWVDVRDFGRVAVAHDGAPATPPAAATAQAANAKAARPSPAPPTSSAPQRESTASQWNRVFQRK